MKAIGIDAIVLNDDLDIIKKESTLIKALLDTNGKIIFENILNLNTREEIEVYEELENFINHILQTSKEEFGPNYNVFDISAINEENDYLWTIRCTFDNDVFIYTFKSPNENKFIATLVCNA